MKFRWQWWMWMAVLLAPNLSRAAGNVADTCDSDGDGKVDDFDPTKTSEDAQGWYLAHATSLGMVLSPLGVATTLKPMQFNVSLELNQIKYLSCQEQAVLDGTKTEDTNKTPLLPRPRLTLALPFSWISVVGLPPAKLFGVKTGVVGGDIGARVPYGDGNGTAALRGHVVAGQIVGDIAHPYGALPGDPGYEDLAIDDEYQFFTAGVDVSTSWKVPVAGQTLTPYLGAGWIKANSIFFIGEDSYEVFAGEYFLKYYHDELGGSKLPGYVGPDLFAGASLGPVGKLEGALEFFFIPVRFSIPEELYVSGEPNAYTRNYTSLRVRVGYTFGKNK